MEADAPIPAKRPRALSGSKITPNVKVVECVREFKLPQTFPSLAKNPGQSIITASVPNGTPITNKLQKLKLKSPDGRDLGEFDVQILPQNKVDGKGKTVSVALNGAMKQNDMIVNIKPDPDRPIVTKSLAKYSPSMIRSVNGSMTTQLISTKKYAPKSNVIIKTEDPEKSSTQGMYIPLSSGVMGNSNYGEHQVAMMDDTVNSNKTFVVQSGGNWQVIKIGDNSQNEIQTFDSTPIIVNSSGPGGIDLNSMNVDSLSTGVMSNVMIKNPGMLKNIKNAPIKAVKVINPVANALKRSRASGNDEKQRVVRITRTNKKGVDGSVRPLIKQKKLVNIVDNNSILKNMDDTNEDSSLGDNVVVLPPPGTSEHDKAEKANVRQSYPLRNSHGTVNLIRRGRKDASSIARPCDSTNSPVQNEISPSSMDKSSSSPNEMSESDIASRLSIVSQALNMIGDEEMKQKALKALAECGIGFERLIPTKPPPDQTAIKESQTQTNVFGILDPHSQDFIRVTGDTDSLVRLQEIERQIIVDDTNIPKKATSEKVEFSQKLDEVLDQRWVNKTSVDQVKQLLKVDPLVEKAYNLLERDFKNVKLYDRKGLLNIHKAVLSDQDRAVKRQITILRSSKESVDLPTEDGRTSLELAIKQSVSPEIVNLLLKSGASPTSNEPAHNSALTIAGKETSPFLPQLIKYVSSDGALNNVDSDGFTALHYCVINNDLDGVLALIRANADVNVRDRKSGRTPLFHALENEFLPIAKELLANGAKGNIPNFGGQTVFTLFDDEKHYSLKEALNKSMK